ncbi:E3 ubiquitin-protein ligase Bre1 [Aphelenchoides fujianensis]|nr:E3 ubiquitin-protein ligase Bre1 [Aphelenchoides fujianensis]
MNTYSKKRDRILAFLEGSRKRNGSPEGAEDSRDAMENSQDAPEAKFDVDAALRDELTAMATENKRLEAMIVKLRSEKSRLGTKVAAHEEQMELMETKAENAVNQMEDLRFELEKSIAKEEKLEGTILELKKRNDELMAAPEASKEKPAAVAVEKEAKSEMADISQKQVEDLQFELEVQTEVAEKRLNEIQQLTSAKQVLAEKAQDRPPRRPSNSKRPDVKYRPSSSRPIKGEGEDGGGDRAFKHSPTADEGGSRLENELHDLRAKVAALDGEPGGHPKAAANCGSFANAPLTRKRDGGWTSAIISSINSLVRSFVHSS